MKGLYAQNIGKSQGASIYIYKINSILLFSKSKIEIDLLNAPSWWPISTS